MKPGITRKPFRPRSRLMTLPPPQREILINWLTSGLPYTQVKILVEEQFHFPLKSTTSLQRFWVKVCTPLLPERNFCPSCFTRESWRALRNKTEKALQDPKASVDDFKPLVMLLYKAGDQAFRNNRLEFDHYKQQLNTAGAYLKNLPEVQRIAAENPFDDDVKLEQIRLLLFGPPPPQAPLLQIEDTPPAQSTAPALDTPDASSPSPLNGERDQG